jgi:Na+:H+ antiporter, NhaA family
MGALSKPADAKASTTTALWPVLGLVVGAVGAISWTAFSSRTYFVVWNRPAHLTSWQLSTWRDVVTNGAMSLFFAAIGLELGRELERGALRHRASRTTVISSAIGGMAVPALLTLMVGWLLQSSTLERAWGVPMSTDVAFAVSILALVAPARTGLRTSLLAIAVVDDALGIIVLATQGHHHYHLLFLVLSAAVLIGVSFVSARSTFATLLLLLLAYALWLRSGISPSLGAVMLGLVWRHDSSARLHVERLLTSVGTFVALPLYALSSVGMNWSTHPLRDHASLIVGLVAARLVGKTAGVTVGATIGHRLGGHLPGLDARRDLVGVGLLAAMGVTVPLYFARLIDAPASPTYGAITFAMLGATLLGGALGAAYFLRRR